MSGLDKPDEATKSEATKPITEAPDMVQGEPCAYYYDFVGEVIAYNTYSNDVRVRLPSGREITFDPWIGDACDVSAENIVGKTIKVKDAWLHICWMTNTKVEVIDLATSDQADTTDVTNPHK